MNSKFLRLARDMCNRVEGRRFIPAVKDSPQGHPMRSFTRSKYS